MTRNPLPYLAILALVYVAWLLIRSRPKTHGWAKVHKEE